MGRFLYAKEMKGAGEKLKKALVSAAGMEEVVIFPTIVELARRLYPCSRENRVVVMLTTNREELLELFAVSDLIGNLNSILVLPDREPGTLKIGALLAPRFTSYADSAFFDIRAMIGAMGKNTTQDYLDIADNYIHSGYFFNGSDRGVGANNTTQIFC